MTVGDISASPDLDLLCNVLLIGLLVATVGIALLGGLIIVTGVLPRWCGVALIAGGPLGVFFTLIPSAALGEAFSLGGAFQALGGVLRVLVGYAIFRAARIRLSEQPSLVR